MRTNRLFRGICVFSAVGLLSLLVQSDALARKPTRQVPTPSQIDSPPPPTPMTILPPAEHIETIGAPCCEHKCCKRRERKCKHACEPITCAPSIEYKGCPAPCSVTRLVTVNHPKSCSTIEVPVQVPASCQEKIDRDHDGDVELDYGKYEVTLRWRDGGRRLVVHYDD
jgi:hypothetical protein